MELRHNAHSVTYLYAHIVFITKYRAKSLDAITLANLKTLLEELCRREYDAQLVEFNGEADHVHLLVNYGPTTSISTLVQTLKGTTSFTLGTKWAVGYFAGAVGSNVEDVKKYIQNQETPK